VPRRPPTARDRDPPGAEEAPAAAALPKALVGGEEPPPPLPGRRIRVYWPAEECWFRGRVISSSAVVGQTIQYDDGETKRHLLDVEGWQWEYITVGRRKAAKPAAQPAAEPAAATAEPAAEPVEEPAAERAAEPAAQEPPEELHLHLSCSNTTGYRGVFKDAHGRFYAQHKIGVRTVSSASFDTAVEAAEAYARSMKDPASLAAAGASCIAPRAAPPAARARASTVAKEASASASRPQARPRAAPRKGGAPVAGKHDLEPPAAEALAEAPAPAAAAAAEPPAALAAGESRSAAAPLPLLPQRPFRPQPFGGGHAPLSLEERMRLSGAPPLPPLRKAQAPAQATVATVVVTASF